MTAITDDLAAHWPDMQGIPEGADVFAQYPIYGVPTPAERAAEVAALRASARRADYASKLDRADVLAFLRKLSRDGYMPTHAEYNAAKPREWPLAHNLVRRRRDSWATLAREAGLKLQPKGAR